MNDSVMGILDKFKDGGGVGGGGGSSQQPPAPFGEHTATFQPMLPGQMNALTNQLMMGYGSSMGRPGIEGLLSDLYRPMTINTERGPFSTKRKGGDGDDKKSSGGSSGPSALRVFD